MLLSVGGGGRGRVYFHLSHQKFYDPLSVSPYFIDAPSLQIGDKKVYDPSPPPAPPPPPTHTLTPSNLTNLQTHNILPFISPSDFNQTCMNTQKKPTKYLLLQVNYSRRIMASLFFCTYFYACLGSDIERSIKLLILRGGAWGHSPQKSQQVC